MYGKVQLNKTEIGLYLYSITGTELYIHNLELKSKYRGKRLFKQLFRAIKNTAISNNCTTIRLEPKHQRIPGKCPSTGWLKGLYSRYGFKTSDGRFYTYKINSAS